MHLSAHCCKVAGYWRVANNCNRYYPSLVCALEGGPHPMEPKSSVMTNSLPGHADGYK